MKTIKKNVYYCDHCKKKGLAASHIRNHEGRCTNNPNRWCGACEDGVNLKEIIQSLTVRFKLIDNPCAADPSDPFHSDNINTDEKIVEWTGSPITLKEIRSLANDCPACIFSILRQSGLNRHYFHLEKFEFKSELKAYMADKISMHNY